MLNIRKGAVYSDKASRVYSRDSRASDFQRQRLPALRRTITSANLATNNINSNISAVDAGDRVTMAVVIENTGRNAAYNVQVKDSLPAGLTFVPGSVCVTNGAGTVLAATDLGGGFLSSGLELTPALGRGKLSDGTLVTDGSNILIVTDHVTCRMRHQKPIALIPIQRL